MDISPTIHLELIRIHNIRNIIFMCLKLRKHEHNMVYIFVYVLTYCNVCSQQLMIVFLCARLYGVFFMVLRFWVGDRH